MKKDLKRIFYLITLALLVYAPNVMAVACYERNQDLIVDNGSSEVVIDGQIPNIISVIVLIIKIAVPVLLVIMGMIDLGKAVVAQKDDEIKKGQQLFVKRLIAGLLVFFSITIVQMLVNFADNDKDGNIMGCAKCFLNGVDKCKHDYGNGFLYMDCSLDGYTFQLRSDGHIPGASVSGNGVIEAYDAVGYNDGSKCPSPLEYTATVTNDGLFVITKK